MIFAELHGKLGHGCSRADERLEDLLTSTAFGLLRYLPLHDGLLPLLRRARFVTIEEDAVSTRESPKWLCDGHWSSPEVVFWPRWGRYGEPDLLLLLRDGHDALARAVLIEAKLYSPKSGSAGNDDAGLADPEVPDPDQLVRYWQGLASRYGGVERTVIYLTSHGAPPAAELAESLRREPSMRLAWLSWRDVWRIADNAARKCLAAQDLATLLRYKGLYCFSGFSELNTSLPISASASYWRGRRWFSRLGLSMSLPAGLFHRNRWFRSPVPTVGSGRFLSQGGPINQNELRGR